MSDSSRFIVSRRRTLGAAIWTILFSGLWLAAPAFGQDPKVKINAKRSGNGYVLSAVLQDCLDATITLECELVNMAPATPLPMTVDSAGRKEFDLVRIRSIDPSRPGSLGHKIDFRMGGMVKEQPKPYAYSLPYRDEPFVVTQGPRGSTHGKGTDNEEAIDWQMPVGTKIFPARSGVVVAYREACHDNAPGEVNPNDYNFIVIRHEDGTYAEYQHLKQDGVLVNLGDKVTEKDPIALSGNSGLSRAPHLHFVVFVNESGNKRRTLLLEFKLPNGEVGPLVQWKRY